MTRNALSLTLCVAAAALLLSAPASAAPSSKRYQAVQARIAAARQADRRSFQSLASLKARVPELDRKKRGRYAALTPILRAMGPGALLPMLEELSASRPETLTGTARTAWRGGLLEALGALHDPAVTPVARRVIDDESDPVVIRAAASAIGNVGDQEALDALLPLAAAPGPKQIPVILGMGECRRLAAAKALAALLAKHPGEDVATALVKALGELATAWAWQTPRLAALKEGDAVRALGAAALVEAYARHGGAVREAAVKAVLLVDAPQTPALIERAKAGASAGTQEALSSLAARFAASPFRRK